MMSVAATGQLSTAANIATVAAAGVAGWGFMARIGARMRRSGVLARLTRVDAQTFALMTGIMLALLVELIFVGFDNHALNTLNHSLSAQYLAGLKTVEKYGNQISRTLNSCLSRLPQVA
jgi:hypothetical protein